MYSARKNKQQTKVTQKQGRKIKRRNHTSADPTIKKKEHQDTKIEIKYKRGTIQKKRTIITMTKVVVEHL